MVNGAQPYGVIVIAAIDGARRTAFNRLDGYVAWARTDAIAAVSISGNERRAIIATVEVAVLLEENCEEVGQMLL